MSEYRELLRQRLRQALDKIAKLQEQDSIDMLELDKALAVVIDLKNEIMTLDRSVSK
jgi:hypothetical protein